MSDNLRRPGSTPTLSSRFFQTELNDTSEPQNNRVSGQRVELLLVKIAHRPYGLLLSQIFNIVRPENGEVRVLRLPDPAGEPPWGEIFYQGAPLRVLELARMLEQPLVEPIDRSQILLTGKLRPNGMIDQPFGLAVDDILAVQTVSLNDLRLLPDWLCQKRLGRLVWAAALLDQNTLMQQSAARELQSQIMLMPVQLSDFMIEPVQFEDTPGGYDLPSLSSSRPTTVAPVIPSALVNNFPVNPKIAETTVRPVMLLDVSTLKSVIYTQALPQ